MPPPSKVQSNRRYPLTSILGSAGNVRILRVLAADRAPQSAPQLARMAGLTPQGVRLVLDALLRQRLLVAHGTGRTRLYALNSSHPFADAIVALFEKEQQCWEELFESIRNVLDRHGEGVDAAWLYGSVARGEDVTGSDLDIAVLIRSHALADRVREDLMPVEDDQDLHISLTALTPMELATLPEDDPWWSDVVRDGKVLKGPAPDQARRRLAKAVA